MANEEHLKILKQGVAVWNKWIGDHPFTLRDLRNAELRNANLSGANLSGANLVKASLSRANLSGANLVKANLTGANLCGADLTGADLTGASFVQAFFIEASLVKANLAGANLIGANLVRAEIVGADLTGADLTGANLTGAYLAGAYLVDAVLVMTILKNAIFGATTFADVDLSTAVGLETARHKVPSSIGVDTLLKSSGQIPEAFLRGVGLPDAFIEYLPFLLEQPIQFHSVFISYSRKDKAFARHLYDALQGRGIRCWLDEHQLLPGDKIAAGIDQGIKLWDKVLLCCSKDSLTSWWVKHEVELAIQKEQRLYDKETGQEVLALIPLNLDGYMFNEDWTSDWKGQITSRLAPNFTGWQRSHKKFEEQLERVMKALRADAAVRGIPPQPKL